MGLCCLAVNTQVILRGIFHIQLFFSVIKMLEFVLFIYFFLVCFNLPVCLYYCNMVWIKTEFSHSKWLFCVLGCEY